MTVFSVLKQIDKQRDSFTRAERAVADYVMAYPSHVMHMTTKELSQACNSSEAAIIRFCKRTGIHSFKRMKLELAKEIHAADTTGSEEAELPFEVKDDVKTVMQKVIHNSIQTLQATEQLVSTESIQEVVKLLDGSERVFLFGIGGSSVVAKDFEQKLIRININAFRADDVHLQMAMIANATEKDLLIVVSTSGKTKEAVEVLALAKEKGVHSVLITQSSSSPAKRFAEHCIQIPEEEQNLRIATMTARLAQLVIVDTLFVSLCSVRGEEVFERIINTHKAVQRMKS